MELTQNKSNCLICGEDVIYQNSATECVCFFCKKSFMANAVCKSDHYVCDNCHSQSSDEVIIEFCLGSDSVNPTRLAQELRLHPSVMMHGPEHHF